VAVITGPDLEVDIDIDSGVDITSRDAGGLMGSSLFRVGDLENDGCFRRLSAFPQINVIEVGTYRLKFTHLRVRGYVIKHSSFILDLAYDLATDCLVLRW
jgi:hypothetical protein